MTVFIASDHRGFKLKEYLKKKLREQNIETKDFGTHSEDSCDYPDFVFPAAKEAAKQGARLIVICGSGLGASMCANKVPGIRCALITTASQAKSSREHNDANAIALPADLISKRKAWKFVKLWLQTPFSEEERHKRRLKKIKNWENKIFRRIKDV